MAHHKRKGPKSTRSGCLLCHPHKHQAHRHSRRAKRERRALAHELKATETP
jgi:hypothetical protein